MSYIPTPISHDLTDIIKHIDEQEARGRDIVTLSLGQARALRAVAMERVDAVAKVEAT